MTVQENDLFNEDDIRKKYIIMAGKNRYDRQLYVNCFNDCDILQISAVPCAMSKTKAIKTLKRIQKQFIEMLIKYPRKYDKDTKFEIVEYKETYRFIKES